jgi:5-methylcytosine-specific restriction enzyme A
MPIAPGRVCGCGRIVAAGARCATCAAIRDVRRGTSAGRGYDARWRRLRAWHLTRRPLCAWCERAGRVTRATLVDHLVPITGSGDPRRLDPTNLQSLCRDCHARKTWADTHGGSPHGET